MAYNDTPIPSDGLNVSQPEIRENFQQLNELQKRNLTNGYIPNKLNELVVTHVTGLTVQADTGEAIIEGILYQNDAAKELTLQTADSTYDRIDRIVLRLDLTIENRSIEAVIKTGTPASSPSAPSLQRDNNIYELSLAQILVPAGAGSIDNTNIIDERDNNDYCGRSYNPTIGDFLTDNLNENVHPFSSINLKTLTNGTSHVGLTSAIFSLKDKWVIVWRDAFCHTPSCLGEIKAADSYDNGKTLENIRTIYSETDMDVRDFSTAKMNGRLGIVASRSSDPDTHHPPVFIYSDDEGSTWNSTILSGVSNGFRTWFGILDYPASVGGDDNNGYICYGTIQGTWDGIKYLYTTDNGASWTEGMAINTASSEEPSEPAVCRIGDEDKWAMVWRRNQASDLNAHGATSKDMLNWNGPYDTGQQLGQNPPQLIYDKGEIHFYAFSRKFLNDRPIPDKNGNLRDGLLHQKNSAQILFNNNMSVWPGWKIIMTMPNPLGYLTFIKENGIYYGLFAYNQIDSRRSNLAVISPEKSFEFTSDNIVEIGSNSNGVYMRFSNGYQFLFAHLQLTYDKAERLTKIWTYPKEFVATPYVDFTMNTDDESFSSLSTVRNLSYSRVGIKTNVDCRLEQFANSNYDFVSGDYASADVFAFGKYS